MSNLVVSSYNISMLVKDFIKNESKKKNISQGKFISFLIEDYKKKKSENNSLKTYFEMATSKEFLSDQINESEEDLLSEIAYNSSI